MQITGQAELCSGPLNNKQFRGHKSGRPTGRSIKLQCKLQLSSPTPSHRPAGSGKRYRCHMASAAPFFLCSLPFVRCPLPLLLETRRSFPPSSSFLPVAGGQCSFPEKKTERKRRRMKMEGALHFPQHVQAKNGVRRSIFSVVDGSASAVRRKFRFRTKKKKVQPTPM